MSFLPLKLIPDGSSETSVPTFRLEDEEWIPILEHHCDFGPDIFEKVSINLIRNPNINSTHLFRADIVYDSLNDEYTNVERSREEVQQLVREYAWPDGRLFGFQLTRTMIRLMVPRNPQLDKPIAQTCHLMRSTGSDGLEQSLVVYVPHVSQLEALPWYHPTVQCMAYLHTWNPKHDTSDPKLESNVCPKSAEHQGSLSIHFQLFPSQTFPLPPRLLRTALHLLSTLHKHGQGCLAGYTKRVHHDQLISQQRVQDTYTELKRKHAKRLCDAWVEQTEPSKHVFEDLGIAAFLIELWKDMYQACDRPSRSATDPRPTFPGFVDIGCGNGVLTETLLLSGYTGWGFDARRRKTWSILSSGTQSALRELLLIPAPLFDLHTVTPPASLLSRTLSTIFSSSSSDLQPPKQPWHDGLFPLGTFIISNHADELTPWTPLLAALSHSPFIAIPCCSHNLSGARFRAPSVFNSHTADAQAPTFFAANISKSKSVAISIAAHLGADDACEPGGLLNSDPVAPAPPQQPLHRSPSTGSLTCLAPSARAKQPSAYASLCDWVAHLAAEAGYVVEKEVLRIPSTRNMAIIGRAHVSREDGDGREPADSSADNGYERRVTATGDAKRDRRVGNGAQQRMRAKVVAIARREGADGRVWMERCRGLRGGVGGGGHV